MYSNFIVLINIYIEANDTESIKVWMSSLGTLSVDMHKHDRHRTHPHLICICKLAAFPLQCIIDWMLLSTRYTAPIDLNKDFTTVIVLTSA